MIVEISVQGGNKNNKLWKFQSTVGGNLPGAGMESRLGNRGLTETIFRTDVERIFPPIWLGTGGQFTDAQLSHLLCRPIPETEF